MLADRTSFEIFHQTAALRPTADFFGRGFGMLRCKLVQVFLGFFDAFDVKTDVIEALS